MFVLQTGFVIFQSCIYISIQASIVIAHFYFSYGYLSFNSVVGVLFVVYGFVLNWDFFSRMLGKVDCLLFYLLAMVRFVNHLSCTYTNSEESWEFPADHRQLLTLVE